MAVELVATGILPVVQAADAAAGAVRRGCDSALGVYGDIGVRIASGGNSRGCQRERAGCHFRPRCSIAR